MNFFFELFGARNLDGHNTLRELATSKWQLATSNLIYIYDDTDTR